jgi:hypothetical protein
MRDKIVLKSLSVIDLDEKTRLADDISKVIDHRITRSNHLKSLGSDLYTKIKDRFKHGKGSSEYQASSHPMVGPYKA